jgi:hypothetical protein
VSEPPQGKRKGSGIYPWVIRALSLSLVLAMIDCWSGFFLGSTPCSLSLYKLRDGGTTGSIGFGYCLTYYRQLDARVYGPEVWFWFTPFVLSAAHNRLEVHWVWKARHD